MKPTIAAAVAGALISGVAMYTVGAKTAEVDAFQTPALVQTLDGQYVEIPGARPVSATATALRPAVSTATVVPVSSRRATTAAPRRTVYRQASPAAQQERVIVEEDAPNRSWGKTALIIGGSAASGAGLGAVIGGKKGAIAGAAIGGGAASIYESTKRR